MPVPKMSSVRFLAVSLVLALGGTGAVQLAQSLPAQAQQAAAPEAAIRVAVQGPQRSEQARARDKYRNPVETLSFFGLKPEMTVVELWPGGGWYTDILAPVLAERGKLIVTSFDPQGPKESPMTKSAVRFQQKLSANPSLYGKAQVAVVTPPASIVLGPDNSADMVLTFRNIHNWVGAGYEEKIYAAAFKVLKKGGVLGVEEHRAPVGADPAKSATDTGYMPEDYVIKKIEAAGFKLDSKSEINANPKDTKNYKGGVWTLPPTLSQGEKDREKYLAIGESDRMTLKFVKP